MEPDTVLGEPATLGRRAHVACEFGNLGSCEEHRNACLAGLKKYFLPRFQDGQYWGMNKPDWKKAADYSFADALDRHGWAWEFMRRNHEYKDDYDKATAGGYIYDPPKMAGEADQAWIARIVNTGDRPNKMRLAVALARKWHMSPPIQSPEIATPPNFDEGPPKRVGYDQVGEYFEDEEPFPPKKGYALLAFDLSRPLSNQVADANRHLTQLFQEWKKSGGKTVRPRNTSAVNWRVFLRIIDAEETATSKEIRGVIKDYHPASESPRSEAQSRR
jgi:hypothetical protein